MIGKTVKVIIDRPIGSVHPNHKNIVYSTNYGYIPNLIAADGEEQDAYVIGIDKPLTVFTEKIIAIIHRKNDIEDKWVVAPENFVFSKGEIEKAVYFQEQFFEIEIEI